jgi:hypothetical protein
MLTGRPPHEGATLRDVLEQARDAPVVPPRKINRRVPRALERVCMKALASDPQSRFRSAEALRQAVGRYRLTRQVAPVLATIAVLLALLVPAWALWPTSVRSSSERQRTEFASQGTMAPISDREQTPQADLRVTRFEIPHFPKFDEKTYNLKAAGLLGKKSSRPVSRTTSPFWPSSPSRPILT